MLPYISRLHRDKELFSRDTAGTQPWVLGKTLMEMFRFLHQLPIVPSKRPFHASIAAL